MNIWTGTVRVVADAEVKHTTSGSTVCNVRLVADSGFGDKAKPLWMRGAIFGKRAEGGLIPYLVKGQKLAVSGELSMNEWANADGIKQQSLEIRLDSIDLVGSKPAQSGGEWSSPAPSGDDSIPF